MTTIRDEDFVFSFFEPVTWNEIYCSNSRLNKSLPIELVSRIEVYYFPILS